MNCLIKNISTANLRRFPQLFGVQRLPSFEYVANENYNNSSRKLTTITSGTVKEPLVKKSSFYFQCIRFKSKKSRNYQQQNNEDSEDEEEEEDKKDFSEGHKGDKQIKKMKVASLRLDSIVASGINKSKK